MELKAFNKEKEYRKLQRNNKAKITYITSLFSVCIIAIVVTFILTNSFAFKSYDSFTLVDATTKLVWDYTYTGTAQEFIVPSSGYYNIELWGTSSDYTAYVNIGPSKGGYISGVIYLQKNEKLYVYIGEGGNDSLASLFKTRPYNGGGTGSLDFAPNGDLLGFAGRGGGATDIRLVGGTWDNSASLRSRIMVAGGAGGQEKVIVDPVVGAIGGSSGGIIGENGYVYSFVNDTHTNTTSTASTGGGQISGGLIMSTGGTNGSFGVGGNANYTYTPGRDFGAGGGGGYYGGASGGYTYDYRYGGAAGSSYISGYAGVNSIQETGGTTEQPLHTNNTKHYSGKYFLNGKMESGVNAGSGKAKISYAGNSIPTRTNTKLDNVRYIKTCNSGSASGTPRATWLELQVIKDGENLLLGKSPLHQTSVATASSPRYLYSTITDGIMDKSTSDYYGYAANTGVQCLVYDLGSVMNVDEVVVWSWHFDGRVYYNNSLSLGTVDTGANTNLLPTILHTYTGTNGYAETSQGRRYTAWD